jgi:ABC-type oligopeptide transport system ATPase subunit
MTSAGSSTLSDHVAVMDLSRIVEQADKTSLLEASLHLHTEALLSAAPIPKYGCESPPTRDFDGRYG